MHKAGESSQSKFDHIGGSTNELELIFVKCNNILFCRRLEICYLILFPDLAILGYQLGAFSYQ